MRLSKTWLAALLIVHAFIGSNAIAEEIRAIWVTRYDYKKESDIEKILSNIAQCGFTDVLFQIRGNGTVFYRSKIEPWAWELTGEDPSTTGRDPGYDPLKTAIREGKKNGLRIHAYANVFPAWRGLKSPPESSKQLLTAHPEWFMIDVTGARMKATSAWYAFLAPTRPEVRQYLHDLFAEIAAYPIDGIHLDYFRYPYDYRIVANEHYPKASPKELERHADFSYDDVTLKHFKDTYGKTPQEFPVAWDNFRRDSVTRTLHEIRRAAGGKLGHITLSSAVLGDVSRARNDAFQDNPQWIARGLLDWALPMMYTASTFDKNLSEFSKAIGKEKTRTTLIPGLNGANNADEIVREVERIRDLGCRGHALFAYAYLFDNTTHKPTDLGRELPGRLYPRK